MMIFTFIPALFAFHIYRTNKLLENYYRKNLNRNREVNHRIKNHLSILKSMIMLKLHNTESHDQGIKDQITAIMNSFLTICDKLLITEDVHHINLMEYILSLLKLYEDGADLKFDYSTNKENVLFQSDKAVHIEMVLSELIGNSIKHAVSMDLIIKININIEKDRIFINFSDNGTASDSNESDSDESFGHTIIKSIVEDNLDGKFTNSTDAGYESIINIPLDDVT